MAADGAWSKLTSLRRRKSAAQCRHGPAPMLADAATQLSETIGCAAETKAAVDAIRTKLDWGYDRVANEVADRMSENGARDPHRGLI